LSEDEELEWWFYPVGGGDMQRVNLPVFYWFGRAIEPLWLISQDTQIASRKTLRLFSFATRFLQRFIDATNEMAFPHSREAAQAIIETGDEYLAMVDAALTQGGDLEKKFERPFLQQLKGQIKDFELLFTRESRKASVFSVTPKGIYDTEKLIESAEKRFPENLLKVMPELTINDLREAGRCLALDVPTACAFHVCRATEALMLAYYVALTGQAWPYKKRDWNIYNDHLAANGAPKAITNRLGEIREDRNAYAHPDTTVPLDEAPIVFELCGGVIHLMAKEMEKIEAAKATVSSPSTPSSTP
jgi:hypothetical protein